MDDKVKASKDEEQGPELQQDAVTELPKLHERPLQMSRSWLADAGTTPDIRRHGGERAYVTTGDGRNAFLTMAQSFDRDFEEDNLVRAALEKMNTLDRFNTAVLKTRAYDESIEAVTLDHNTGKLRIVDVREMNLLKDERARAATNVHGALDFRFRQRLDRVGLELPTVEVRYENLNVEAEVLVGSRAMPTLTNSVLNHLDYLLSLIGMGQSRRYPFPILKNVSGVVHPGRLTLLLGPPGSGKSTLLLALAGRLASDLKQEGRITYNGASLDSFIPKRTASYVEQTDNHLGELTVRETLDFSARVLGVGWKEALIKQLVKKEKEMRIMPDPHIDAFVKASTLRGQQHHVMTDYVLKVLGLDICADTVVGNEMLRGISGGQKKRVTLGEFLAGPMSVHFMDEISTGLDSSTTFQIVNSIRTYTHQMDATVFMSLLQPAPEVFDLFDDVVLLSEGHVVYSGPRKRVLDFFEGCGFSIPERKGVADFLQEVTSKKDQEQYWSRQEPYHYVTVQEFADKFANFEVGKELVRHLQTSLDSQKGHELALQHDRFGLSPWESFTALWDRELILVQRNAFIWFFRIFVCTVLAIVTATLFLRTTLATDSIADAGLYLGALFFSLLYMLFSGLTNINTTVRNLPVFYKQRDNLFFPAWSYALPPTFLELPYSVLEAVVWASITYFTIGFAPSAGRFFTFILLLIATQAMSTSLFRLVGAIGRSMVGANTLGGFVFLTLLVLGGFVLAKDDIPPWWIWGYWLSPLAYAQNAAANNEFTAARWDTPYGDLAANCTSQCSAAVGDILLQSRSIPYKYSWVWLGIGVLFAFSIVLNLALFLALRLPAFSKTVSAVPLDVVEERNIGSIHQPKRGEGEAARDDHGVAVPTVPEIGIPKSGTPTAAATSTATQQPSDGLHAPSDVAGSPQGANAVAGVATHAASEPAADGGPVDVDGARVPQSKAVLQQQASGLGRPNASGLGRPRASGLGRPGMSRLGVHVDYANSFLDMETGQKRKGMVLPFEPLVMTFLDVNYYVDVPKDVREAINSDRLQLLTSVSGVFRPGVLTALMGESGAGKTTLMDVLSGRKTSGYIDGDIRISGFPKEQNSFARISGYVEQSDIHSPQATVREALVHSAWLRLPADVTRATREQFVDEVMELVELAQLAGALVGLPGQTGLSVEQRKRLTIAVELVANPSIIFMDEPTSGLDARAAAIVMRAVRNTVDTGRTVVCTIHQPSIDIFESFDELLLLKRGGQVIYSGPLGERSADLIKYLEGIQGVTPYPVGQNPATWMLEVSSPAAVEDNGIDFAAVYEASELKRQTRSLIEESSKPDPGSEPLRFGTQRARGPATQFAALLWKNFHTYWRYPEYNVIRFVFTIMNALIIGSAAWGIGQNRSSAIDVLNVMGVLYAVVQFMGVSNANNIQPVIAVERIVSYRERSAGMYSSLPWVLAQTVVELPYILAQSIVYSLIVFAMIQFQWTAVKFFWFLFFIFITLCFFTTYGMMAIALTPGVEIAQVLSVFNYFLWNLFAGFIIYRPKMPGWWVWYYYINPLSWSLYGVVGSQLADISSPISLPDGTTQPLDEWLDGTLGIKYSFLGQVSAIMIGFSVGCFLMAVYAFKNFNFQRR